MIKEKYNEKELNAFITSVFIIIQIAVLFISCMIAFYAKNILYYIAPGALERIECAVPLLRIMIFFSLFMSSANVLGNAVQIMNNFSVGPLSQFFLNIALCIEFFAALYFKLSVITIAWCIILNGIIILGMHLYQYYKMNFYFTFPTYTSYILLKNFIIKVVPALLSSMITDINILIDQAVASYLPIGSQSIIDYVNAFVRVPLQIFGSSFATVNTAQFAKEALRSKQRVTYYLFESAKLMIIVSIISMILFWFFSYRGLKTLLLSDNFTIQHVQLVSSLLIIFSWILFFSMFNKIILNVYYAYGSVIIPTIISLGSSAINTLLNFVLMRHHGLHGIILATVIAEIIRTLTLLIYIHYTFSITLPLKKLLCFMQKVFIHISYIGLIGCAFYYGLYYFFMICIPNYHYFFIDSFFYWIWTGPLVIITLYALFKTRKKFGIHIHYLK
jgi:putative peptidoglycan lipid II flippase